MWPNLIVGGAPKCGTSSLYFWLEAHPEVCGSPIKEPFFFDDVVSRFNKGCNIHESPLEDYQKHFERCKNAPVVFEASAVYLYSRTALEWIPKLPEGPPKMIFLLREPAARLYSKWKFNRYKLKTTALDFETFSGLQKGTDQSHFEEGLYATYLSKWVEVLGRNSIQVFVFEELIREPRKTMDALCAFLGIDSGFYNAFSFEQHNETYATRNPDLHRKAVGWLPMVPKFARPVLGKIYAAVNTRTMPKSDPRDREFIEQLTLKYAPSVAELQRLFPELDLSRWNVKFKA